MASDAEGSPRAPITSINITPLVDVTLVLLIIFMVTARFVVNDQALKVDLPRASTGSSVQDILSLVVDAGGGVSVNGRDGGTDEQIRAHVDVAKGANPDVRAVIQADAAVPHGRVMHLLDLIRGAGLTRVAFGVVPAHAAEPAGN